MLSQITNVWSGIISWFVDSMTSVTSLFYTNEQLTFLGVLAVISVGIAVTMLIINKVLDFLKLR